MSRGCGVGAQVGLRLRPREMDSRALSLTGVALVAVAAVGGVLSCLWLAERATITITVPERYVATSSTVHGALTGAQFKTQRLQVALTESATGTATGRISGGGTYATGFVEFGCQTACPPAPAKPGYQVCRIIPTGGTPCYALEKAVTCFCGEFIPVRAVGPGSWYNAPKGTVDAFGWTASPATVINTQPISGGTDGWSSPVVLQSDIDATWASVSAQITTDLQSALQEKAQNLHYFADSAPKLTLSSNVGAGTRTGTFQVTVSGTLGATGFADSDALAAMVNTLNEQLPVGFQRYGSAHVSGFKVEAADARGNVDVTGTVSGYAIPVIQVDPLRTGFRGLDSATARARVESLLPGSAVQIRMSPVPLPWLPLRAGQITVVVAAGRWLPA